MCACLRACLYNVYLYIGMIDVTRIKEYQDVYSKIPTESAGDAEILENKR